MSWSEREFVELERAMREALDTLPAPRAPRTLAPRVMAAIEARRRAPWYTREWAVWPRRWQMASVLLFAVVLALVTVAAPLAIDWVRLVAASGLDAIAARVPGNPALAVASRAVTTVLGVVAERALPLVLFTYVVCVTLGAALVRVAQGEAAR